MAEPVPIAPLRADAAPAVMLDDGTFLIAALGDGVPADVEILPNGDRRLAWRASAISWPVARGEGAPHAAFVALFPLLVRERDRLRSVVLSLPGKAITLALVRPAGGIAEIVRTILAEAGPAQNQVVDGLVDLLLSERNEPARARAAAALLRLAAKHAGFIEVIGTCAEGQTFVQGWASDLAAGRIRALTGSEPPLVTEVDCILYDRDDLSGQGRGFAGILAAAPLDDVASLRQLFYRANDGWRSIDLYDRHRRLAARDVPAHLRDLLPRASGPQDVMARLRLAAHRFDGRETVSQIEQPVRLGIDLATFVRGSGVLIAGWLLDPTGSVREVRLNVGSQAVVISGDWTRTKRRDVANAFGADPLFRGHALEHGAAGFIAFAPRIASNAGDAHLEVEVAGAGPPRHFPLALGEAPLSTALAGLLASLDPRSAAAARTVEKQFGPLLRAYEHQIPPPSDVEDFGLPTDFAEAAAALVIGADDRVAEMTSLLAVLATEPGVRSLPIVLSAPAEAADEVASEISRLARFYRLSVRLVRGEAGADIFDGLISGAAAIRAPTLALLSADVMPATRGWLDRLMQAYRLRGERYLVSPTILFEDGSLRWAGAWLEEDGAERRLTTPEAGFPKAAIAGAAPQETSCGTLECCVLSRAAFEPIRGLSARYLGAGARNLDMALRIRLGGTPSLWLPEVEMIAAPPAARDGAQFADRVDRWSFDRRWSLAITNLSR